MAKKKLVIDDDNPVTSFLAKAEAAGGFRQCGKHASGAQGSEREDLLDGGGLPVSGI